MLFKQYNQDSFHIQHALTMEAVMGWFAKELGYADESDFWSIVGMRLLMLCSLFYLNWWLITFKPPGRKNTIPGTIFQVLASLSGLAGLVPLLRAVSEPGESSGQGMDITLNDK